MPAKRTASKARSSTRAKRARRTATARPAARRSAARAAGRSVVGPVELVSLHVDDFGEAVAFYRDTLGLPLEEKMEEPEGKWASFRVGPKLLLGLHGPPHEPGGRRPGGASGIFFTVRDVDAAIDTLRDRGVKVVEEPYDTGYGRLAIIADPDGNFLGVQRLNP